MNTLNLVKRFATLSSTFHSEVKPTPLTKPYWLHINTGLAKNLGISQFGQGSWLDIVSAKEQITDYPPLASLYAGHQFGVWVPELGDGRAMLIAEHQDPNGKIWELQLKGAGITPFSRMGDGKAVLRSTIREYLCSHAMQNLNIPTTYALGIVGSQDPVYREEIETSAIILRVAESFIRFGHFEVLSSRSQVKELSVLTNFVISNYFPQILSDTNPYRSFFREVIKRTASLIAKWLSVGFCHGVMNTDNMSILGLTIDYGPFGFLDEYDPRHICNHSDTEGRYSYIKQPQIAWWNLKALAHALSLVVSAADLQEELKLFAVYFNQEYLTLMGQKLGFTEFAQDDFPLLEELLAILENAHADWTIFWRKLSYVDKDDITTHEAIIDEVTERDQLRTWLSKYFELLATKNYTLTKDKRHKLMLSVNPKYILRNYLLQNAIDEAEKGNFNEIDILFKIVTNPYEEQPEHETYAAHPPYWAKQVTVSCSS